MTDVNAVIRWHESRIEMTEEVLAFWREEDSQAERDILTGNVAAHRAMAQAIREMQEERDRLRSALEPFADASDYYLGDNPEDAVVRYFADSRTGERRAITIGHLRAARRALSPNQAEP